jgi:hypothetical protein
MLLEALSKCGGVSDRRALATSACARMSMIDETAARSVVTLWATAAGDEYPKLESPAKTVRRCLSEKKPIG